MGKCGGCPRPRQLRQQASGPPLPLLMMVTPFTSGDILRSVMWGIDLLTYEHSDRNQIGSAFTEIQ